MALVLQDRVKETSSTSGTGTITLTGAYTGYRTFNSCVTSGSTVYYTIHNTTSPNDGEWEVGVGTFTSPASLSRDTVLSSSAGGTTKTAFTSASTLEVFITQPSEQALYTNQATGLVEVSGNGVNTIAFTNINASNVVMVSGTISTNAANATDITNKTYVDGLFSQSISYHEAVLVESPNTAGSLDVVYVQPNGPSNGVGATLTNNAANVALVVDGVSLSNTARVLIYSQANAVQNGVYTVTNPGAPDPGGAKWVLTRATDADTFGLANPNALGAGDAFFVQDGNTGAGETYVCNTQGTITFGSSNITFAQISSAQIYAAGTGLNLSNLTFSIANTTVVTGLYGDSATVPVIEVNPQGQLTSVANSAINVSNITVGTLSNDRTTASASNGANTIVLRDANGSFNANVVTATTVNATTGNFTNVTANAAGLTDINASNITSGTISNARTTGNTANSASTIVLRDADGSFAGNVITGQAFSGNAAGLSAINASNISSGTIANARTTAASSNGASTIVLRDSSGNFEANVVNAVSLVGNAAAVTNINASNISSGTVGTGRLASGAATSSTFLRGDQTWSPAAQYDVATTSTGFFALPVGTTGERPLIPAEGYIRTNTSLDVIEAYIDGVWRIVSAYRVPDAPTIGTATTTGSTTATVSFTAPVSDGGDPITSYTAISTPGGVTGTLVQSGSGTITVSGLTTGTAYTFTVFATNRAGNSNNSAASNSITTWAVPGAPTIGTATTTGSTTASVTYTAPANNGGQTITSYTAVSSPGGITGTVSQAGSGTINVTGLTTATSYTFIVRATNSIGNSANSAASNSITTWAVPGAPTIGTATVTSGTTATVSFTAPANNGGQTITSYTAVSSPGGITGTLSQAGSGTITVSGLTSGTSYTFVVYATNSVGNSANSAASNSITMWTVPGAPTIGTATTVNATAATVSYTAPGNNGGTAITSYTAISSPGSYTGTLSQAGSGTITVTGMADGTSYTFVVRATNSVGNSANSAASNSISLPFAPYTVEYVVVAGGGGGGSAGGGGGAGGYISTSTTVTDGTGYSITVGGGGASGPNHSTDGSNGGTSSAFGTSCSGGGGGGSYTRDGLSGGSGGGGGLDGGIHPGGSGTSGQGNAGGYGSGSPRRAGGGGGKNAAGTNNQSQPNGGAGLAWLNGSTYGGGGGGGSIQGAAGTGGAGGGGNGAAGDPSGNGGSATANTGGGAGGSGGGGGNGGGTGGSGIVVLRYAGTVQKGSGGSVSTSGGYTYHTFTSSGTFTG